MTSGQKITLSEEQFERLARIIYERSGIHFESAKKYVLESRLARRLAELEMESYDEYITFLTIGPYRDDEFQEMFNRITINETSFFRNEPQLEVFEKHALPALLEARAAQKRLRIWSAACSSGEEPFTLGIQVHRTLGVRLPDWRIEILGSDISEKALAVAIGGVYGQYALRNTPPWALTRYFKKQSETSWALDPDIRSLVTFERHNLKDRLGARRHGVWDVIFCRNVMIYFDEEMKRRVVSMFSEQLASDGWLFIGHSESLRGLDSDFLPESIPQGFCYRKAPPPPGQGVAA